MLPINPHILYPTTTFFNRPANFHKLALFWMSGSVTLTTPLRHRLHVWSHNWHRQLPSSYPKSLDPLRVASYTIQNIQNDHSFFLRQSRNFPWLYWYFLSLQVEFETIKHITGVSTMGSSCVKEWVIKYLVEYSTDDIRWLTVHDTNMNNTVSTTKTSPTTTYYDKTNFGSIGTILLNYTYYHLILKHLWSLR